MRGSVEFFPLAGFKFRLHTCASMVRSMAAECICEIGPRERKTRTCIFSNRTKQGLRSRLSERVAHRPSTRAPWLTSRPSGAFRSSPVGSPRRVPCAWAPTRLSGRRRAAGGPSRSPRRTSGGDLQPDPRRGHAHGPVQGDGACDAYEGLPRLRHGHRQGGHEGAVRRGRRQARCAGHRTQLGADRGGSGWRNHLRRRG